MHAGLVAVIVAILLMAGIPKSSITVEKKGLRPDRTRPGDVVVLNFYGPGRHMVIDAVISTVNRNTILSVTSLIPGHHVAKLAEDKKFKADEMSSQPVSCKHGGDHVFVPFAMEDGGTLGAHAHALLKTLIAEHAVSAGRYSTRTAPQTVALPCLPPCRCLFGCSYCRRMYCRSLVLVLVGFQLKRIITRANDKCHSTVPVPVLSDHSYRWSRGILIASRH